MLNSYRKAFRMSLHIAAVVNADVLNNENCNNTNMKAFKQQPVCGGEVLLVWSYVGMCCVLW